MKQRGTIRLTGLDKNANLVYVTGKNGIYARSRPKKDSHANDHKLIENGLNTGGYNKFAGQVSKAINLYGKGFIDSGLYQAIKKRFFRTQSSNRLIRLNSLNDMDAHPRNRLEDAIYPPQIMVSVVGDHIHIKTEITERARLEKYLKFYSIQIILILWNNEDETYRHEARYTNWLDASTALPLTYTFKFDKPGISTEYLVLCCCMRGEEKAEKRLPPERALRIVATGSLDEQAVAALAAYHEAKKNEVSPGKRLITRDEGLAQGPDEGIGNKGLGENAP